MKMTTSEKKKLVRSMHRALADAHGKNKYSIKWQGRGKHFKYPTGLQGWCCQCEISAPGFRTRDFKVVWDASGYWKMHIVTTDMRDAQSAYKINRTKR